MNHELSEPLSAILERVAEDDRSAAARLLPVVYEELRALAGSFFRLERTDHTLQPTALVHEAYARLVAGKNTDFSDRRHFFEVAASVMRHVLTDHARAHRALKRGGDWRRVTVNQDIPLNSSVDIDPLELEEALRKLEKLNARHAKIVELRFFAGLTVEQIAEFLELSKRTIELDWRTARSFLQLELQNVADS